MGFTRLLDILVLIQFQLNLSQMSSRYANRSQVAPGYPKHVIPVVLILLTSVEEGLVVEVQNLEEDEGVWVQQQMSRIVDVEF
jgi:hypothetical protein